MDNTEYGTEISLDHFITVLAKALCIERYIAVNKLEKTFIVDADKIHDYYEQNSEVYDSKAVAILEMVGINLIDEDLFENISNIYH